MKRLSESSTNPDRATAWACAMTNLLIWPGLGSVVGGKRSGYVQMVLAAAGFVLTSLWGAWFIGTWWRLRQIPMELGPEFGKGATGAVLFLVSWIWALLTSLAMLRASSPSSE